MRRRTAVLAIVLGVFVIAGSASALNLSPWFVVDVEPTHPFAVVDFDGDGAVYVATTTSSSGNSGGGRGQNYIGDDSGVVGQDDPYVLTSASFGFTDDDGNGDGLVSVRTLSICHSNGTCTTSQVVKDNN